MKLAVVILAGGQGSRIGGGKALKTLGGERLIDRAAAQGARMAPMRAVALRDSDQIGDTDIEVILDDPAIEGPLGGLAAALRFARDRECSAVLTIPADMPFLPPDLALRLAEEIRSRGASLAASGGHAHPVCGLWRVGSLAHLEAYVETGRRSLKGFAEAVGFVTVDWPDQPLDPFFNINTEEDLAEAERLLAIQNSRT